MVEFYYIYIFLMLAFAALGFIVGRARSRKAVLEDAMRDAKLAEQASTIGEQKDVISSQQQEIRRLTAELDLERANAVKFETLLDKQNQHVEEQRRIERENADRAMRDMHALMDKRVADLRQVYDKQVEELRDSFQRQLASTKENAERQLETLRAMNKEQVDGQLKLIREQMQTTSEEILKRRQEELGERNVEQVSKIVDPLQQSLKDMREALDKNKEQQVEAMARLDEAVKTSLRKSVELGETADRLTRALTGEVKVQGNFGELKLRQLLEDLELREGEQYDTQETLRDKTGKGVKGDDGKGMVPDFILHFPGNRHVVVDSKMSLTAYERYMNAEDGSEEKSSFLHAHIDSVRAQVRRLSRKEYARYLPEGYNRLDFAIMYIPIEGALNLALLNDNSLWREAYDQDVLILGPQTMYMNLRVLEMMWTQVRQLHNQQAMMDAANVIIDRIQDFGMRFSDVESGMRDTIRKMDKLKITTSNSGPSIITAARTLLKAGAKENRKKKPISDMDGTLFLDDTEAGGIKGETPEDRQENT